METQFNIKDALYLHYGKPQSKYYGEKGIIKAFIHWTIISTVLWQRNNTAKHGLKHSSVKGQPR